MTARERLAAFLKKARGENTQEAFAEKLGVTGAYISALEKGRKVPSVEFIDRLGDRLKIDTEDARNALRRVKEEQLRKEFAAVSE